MKYRNIIFDLDGTLWNANEPTAKSFNKSLKALNIDCKKEMDVKYLEKICGKSSEECWAIIKKDFELDEDAADIVQRIHSDLTYDTINNEGALLYDNVKDGLEKLSNTCNLYLISNCEDWYLEAFLNLHNMRNVFKDWDCFGISNVPKAKMIRDMVRKYKMKSVIYVGDTEGDEQSCRESGVDFAHVLYGFGKANSPVVAFDNFNYLVEYFL